MAVWVAAVALVVAQLLGWFVGHAMAVAVDEGTMPTVPEIVFPVVIVVVVAFCVVLLV